MTSLDTAHLSTLQLATTPSTSARRLKTINLQSLEKVDASTLPVNILVLLSKYAKALKENDGIIIQVSSLKVFKDVHDTSLLSKSPLTRKIHRQLLVQVKSHINLGSMYLIGQKTSEKIIPSVDSFPEKRQQVTLDVLVRRSPYNRVSGSFQRNLKPNDDEPFKLALD